jgi:hypothetical protein
MAEDNIDAIASEVWGELGLCPVPSSFRTPEPLKAVPDALPNVLKRCQHRGAFAYREPSIFVLS